MYWIFCNIVEIVCIRIEVKIKRLFGIAFRFIEIFSLIKFYLLKIKDF